VGSNASALEATFNIMDISGMDDLINKFYFLSRDGAFPSRIMGQINVNNYKFEALNSKTLLKLLQNRFWRQLKRI
jgi:hypothetical protein